MKTINLNNVVLFIENGDIEPVRRLRDACAARLRHMRVDPASISPATPTGQKINGISFNEASVHSYIDSENRLSVKGSEKKAFIESLSTLYAACLGRVGA